MAPSPVRCPTALPRLPAAGVLVRRSAATSALGRAQCCGQGATPPPMVCGEELGDDHVDISVQLVCCELLRVRGLGSAVERAAARSLLRVLKRKKTEPSSRGPMAKSKATTMLHQGPQPRIWPQTETRRRPEGHIGVTTGIPQRSGCEKRSREVRTEGQLCPEQRNREPTHTQQTPGRSGHR